MERRRLADTPIPSNAAHLATSRRRSITHRVSGCLKPSRQPEKLLGVLPNEFFTA
ncbi:hypothetical protein [Kingella oralis]|uniref:hypothetical protein n=1 Tax=Kingella oralis TaxID=505 RepID=UPI0034E534F5